MSSMPSRMRVGFVQFEPKLGEPDTNLASMTDLLAKAPPADLIVLPELALTGYALGSRKRAEQLAEPTDGPHMRRLSQLAGDLRVHLVVGFARADGEKVLNSAALLGDGRAVHHWDKTHLFWNEPDLFDPGQEGFTVAEVCGVPVGGMICFDYAFPESAGTLARRGALVIAHPSNLVLPHARRVMPVRCLENRVYAVTCNRIGEEPGNDGPLRFSGGSVILDPSGRALASAPDEDPSVEVVAIDPREALDKKLTPRNHLFYDRRPDLYD